MNLRSNDTATTDHTHTHDTHIEPRTAAIDLVHCMFTGAGSNKISRIPYSSNMKKKFNFNISHRQKSKKITFFHISRLAHRSAATYKKIGIVKFRFQRKKIKFQNVH